MHMQRGMTEDVLCEIALPVVGRFLTFACFTNVEIELPPSDRCRGF